MILLYSFTWRQMEDDMEMEMELAEEFAPLPTANDETVKVNDELEELELTNTAASWVFTFISSNK